MVEELLQDKNIYFLSKGKDLLIKCLNPEHEDDTPSLRIDRESGLFHCLSCGYKGNIYTYFNKHRNIFNTKVRNTQNKILELRKASWSGFNIPQDAFFVSQDFRDIDKDTITKFSGFLTEEYGMSDRLVFPIYDNSEKIVAFQGRYINSNATPKYMMYPKEVSLPLYPNPARLDLSLGYIVLVEGLIDALSLRSKGIVNAVTSFGTKSISMDTIYDLTLNYRLTGIEKIYIMMDGDSAGRSAALHIQKCIKYKTDMLTEIIDLPDGRDPAELDNKEIDLIKQTLQSV